jgi:acetyl esterase/lipase
MARSATLFAEGLSAIPLDYHLHQPHVERDDILTLASRLRDAGVEVTLHRAKDMPHNAPVFAAYHQEGKVALEAMVGFIQRRLA